MVMGICGRSYPALQTSIIHPILTTLIGISLMASFE